MFGSYPFSPGFTEAQVNKTVPEILHINRDGYLPDIRVVTNENTSVLSFVICQKLSSVASMPELNQDYGFQVILLSFDEVLPVFIFFVESMQGRR